MFAVACWCLLLPAGVCSLLLFVVICSLLLFIYLCVIYLLFIYYVFVVYLFICYFIILYCFIFVVNNIIILSKNINKIIILINIDGGCGREIPMGVCSGDTNKKRNIYIYIYFYTIILLYIYIYIWKKQKIYIKKYIFEIFLVFNRYL